MFATNRQTIYLSIKAWFDLTIEEQKAVVTMRYSKLIVRNFKGIQNLEFDLDGRKPASKVFTLVGLNESGKTTILEAMSFFYDNIIEEEEVKLTRAIVDDIHESIPKSKK